MYIASAHYVPAHTPYRVMHSCAWLIHNYTLFNEKIFYLFFFSSDFHFYGPITSIPRPPRTHCAIRIIDTFHTFMSIFSRSVRSHLILRMTAHGHAAHRKSSNGHRQVFQTVWGNVGDTFIDFHFLPCTP